jgi:predicted metal-dependent HD superfamily phosphohydrolase
MSSKHSVEFNELHSRWDNLMKEAGVGYSHNTFSPGYFAREAVFLELFKKYSESHRFYHNQSHWLACWKELDSVLSFVENPLALKFGLAEHDSIYSPSEKDNEERSIVRLETDSERIKIPAGLVSASKKIVQVTDHKTIPSTLDECFAVDIDLSIFGKAEDVFDVYEVGIKKEYSFVKERAFRLGRSKVLQSFLDRKSVYYTPFFRDKYEAQARKNLERSIQKLV